MGEPSGFRSTVMADVHRLDGRTGWGTVARQVLMRRTFRVVFTLRVCGAIGARPGARWLLPAARLWHRWACGQAGVDIPWQVQAGPGLVITHGWGLVLAPDVILGSNVTLFHGVTLGRRVRIGRHGETNTGSPTIGDQAWIGPHAVVVGGVAIGAGSRIAANAFVTESVPARSTVIGNPATVTRSPCQPDCAHPAPLPQAHAGAAPEIELA